MIPPGDCAVVHRAAVADKPHRPRSRTWCAKGLKMPFSAKSPEERRRASRIGRLGDNLVRRDPSAAGKRSWAVRSPEQKERTTQALLAAADRAKGGRVMAAKAAADPLVGGELRVARSHGKACKRARRLGMPEPQLTRIYDGPLYLHGSVRRPGRSRRKKAEREARRALALAAEGAANDPWTTG
jgi:hypothetical protein